MQRGRHEVAIRRRVDAVGHHAGESEPVSERGRIDRIARARHRPRPERHRVGLSARRVQAGVVTLESRGVGEQEMGHEDGLSAPQVGVGRHDRLTRRRRAARKRGHQRDDLPLQHRQPPPQVEAQIQRYLLVARTTGVEPAPDISQAVDELALDERVHVLVGTRDEPGIVPTAPADLDQRVANGAGVGGRQHAGSGQRLGPGQTPLDIVLEQAPVEPERGLEAEDLLVGSALEPAGPQMRLVAHVAEGPVGSGCPAPVARRLLATLATGRPQISMKPSAAP